MILSRTDPFHSLMAAMADFAVHKVQSLAGVLVTLFTAPGSSFSMLSLLTALSIAGAWLVIQRRARGRHLTLKLAARALFPRWLWRSASTKADGGFFLLNVFAVSGLIGWGLISYGAVEHWTGSALTHALGPRGPGGVGRLAGEAIMTLALFLAYEFAYWLDHFIAHEVPFFWEFHRVHHTAETLTPLTVFRVHPVDTMKFFNIIALVTGVVGGVGGYLLGQPTHAFSVSGNNILLLAFIFLTVHLQHSHVWIAFTGVWGRVFASPAHHQIHHSADPAHFGKNLGSCLVVFDWLFGTLRVPRAEREPLVYGVEPGGESPHTITGGLITPFERGLATLRPPGLARPAATDQIPVG